MSREITAKEAIAKFLVRIKQLVNYWDTVKEESHRTTKSKLNGLAFSILSTIDGCGFGIPAIAMSLCPHPEDKDLAISQGEDYYQDGMVINDCELHEEYSKLED